VDDKLLSDFEHCRRRAGAFRVIAARTGMRGPDSGDRFRRPGSDGIAT
jgi:hypothetical protein